MDRRVSLSAETAQPPDGTDQIQDSYAAYYASGTYDQRYPRPNLGIWRRILSHLTPQSHLIDYGCGNGRYLLGLQPHLGQAAGFDISAEAIGLLRARADAQGWDSLVVLGPDPDALGHYVADRGAADVVLCLFGVIGHIDTRAARIAVLTQIRTALKQGSGRLLISVPNGARRFRAEQREAGPGADGLIAYRRDMADGSSVTLSYQMYSPARLRDELAAAGFNTLLIGSESVLPESWLLRVPFIRHLDAWLSQIMPPKWAYGIYAEAAW